MLSTGAKLPLELLPYIIPDCIKQGYYNTISRTCKTANQFARTDYKNHIQATITNYDNNDVCESIVKDISWRRLLERNAGTLENMYIISPDLLINITCDWNGPGRKLVNITLNCNEGLCTWKLNYSSYHYHPYLYAISNPDNTIETSNIINMTNLMQWIFPDQEDLFKKSLELFLNQID